MKGLLVDKKIVIIGGTSGIGLSAVRSCIKQGALVVALGLENKDLTHIDHCEFIDGDATLEGESEKAISQCHALFGGCDGMFHVAGGSGRKWGDGPLHELSLEAWNKTLELNLTSVMLSNQAAIRYFLKHQIGGSILNLSSVLGYQPSSRYFYTHAYAAAKSAIIGFSKSIASFYAPDNIRVNVLAPSLIDTPMASRASKRNDIRKFIKTKQPLDGGRIGHTDDLDAAAIYFLGSGSGFTTGQVLAVDGGWSLSDGQYER